MTRLRVEKWLIGPAIVAAAMATGGRARASGEGAADTDKHDSAPPPSASASGSVSVGVGTGSGAERVGERLRVGGHVVQGCRQGQGHGGGKDKDKDEEKIFRIGLDLVIGTARTNTLSQSLPIGYSPTSTQVAESDRITTYSMILDAGWEVTHHFEVGLRLPMW